MRWIGRICCLSAAFCGVSRQESSELESVVIGFPGGRNEFDRTDALDSFRCVSIRAFQFQDQLAELLRRPSNCSRLEFTPSGVFSRWDVRRDVIRRGQADSFRDLPWICIGF